MNKFIKIGIFIGIYLISMILIFGIKKDNNSIDNKERKYIIFDNYLILNYSDNKITQSNFDDNDYIKGKFYSYVNGNYIGNYYYRNINADIYLFDDENKSIKFDGNLVVNNYDKEMKIIDLKELPINSNDEIYATNVLNKYNLLSKYNKNVMNLKKYEIDLDNDSLNETLYLLNAKMNEQYLDLNTKFSFLYYEKNGKIKYIDKYLDNSYALNITNILDIDKNGNLEIVGTKSNSSYFCYQIYTVNKKGEVKKHLDC